ncbi:MAG: glycosyltransferase family 39 protein, partial [Bacteroidetes bacterium]|nr:glycosyltransferase family 39 protein [Bacteroidota bacterium]
MPPTKKSFFEKTEVKFLGIILFVGFLLRIIFYFELKNTPLFSDLFSDSRIYFDFAKDIVRKNDWFGSTVFYMSPAYTYFLALVRALFDDVFVFARFIQILISTVNILLIYLIAKKLFSPKAGYAAAFISAIYSVFIFYSASILIETLQTFFVSLLIFYLIKDADYKFEKHWLIIGILLSISALFRANILLFILFIVPWLIYNFRQSEILKPQLASSLLFLVLGIIIPILPITINNYLAEKDFVLITSNSGINFFIGNNDEAVGVYKTPKNIDLSLDLSGEKNAEKIAGKELKPSEVSEFWFDKGVEYVTSNPGKAGLLTLKKFFLFFDNKENPQSAIMDINFFAKHYSTLFKLPLPGFYFVFLLSLAGIILSFNKTKYFTIIYYFILSYVLSTVIFFVMGRFRVALAPVLIVFAGYGAIKIYEIIRSKEMNKLIIPAGVILFFIIINVTFVPKFTFTEYDAYLNLGNSYFEKQEYDRALDYYKKSLALHSNDGIYILIGNTLAVKKDVSGAFESYKKAIEMNPENPLSHFNLGV